MQSYEYNHEGFVVKTLHPQVITPHRATAGAAGHDIFLPCDLLIVRPGETVKIHTGVVITKLPKDGFMSVHAKSGLFVKHQINVTEQEFGLGDELTVTLTNHSAVRDHTFNYGDKIAQVICRLHKRPVTRYRLHAFSDSYDPAMLAVTLTHKRGMWMWPNIDEEHFGLVERRTKDFAWKSKTLGGVIDSDYKKTLYACTIPKTRVKMKREIGKMNVYRFANKTFLDGKLPKQVRDGGFGSTGASYIAH